MTETIYIPAKFVAYFFVALFGARHLKLAPDLSVLRSGTVAVVRMLIGLVFALPIYLASTMLDQRVSLLHNRLILIYVLIYVPARWVAWSLTTPVLTRRRESLNLLTRGVSKQEVQWRLLGVAVSCALDLLVVASFGRVPIGKFFC